MADILYVGANPGGGAIEITVAPFAADDGVNDYYILAATLAPDDAYALAANDSIIFNAGVTFGTAGANIVSVLATNNIDSTGFNVATGGGTLLFNAATLTLGAITTNGGLLRITNNGAASQSGAFTLGAGGLRKQGAGTLTLSQANSYTGITTIDAGKLSTDVLAGGNLAINNGTTFEYTGNSVSTNRNVTLDANGNTSVISVTNPTANLTISGVIANGDVIIAAPLTKQGSGTLTLSGANTYTGTTTVSAGTLAYGITNALSSGGVTVSGGTLDIGAFSDTVGAVTLTSGNITGSTGVLTGTSYAMQSGTVGAILGGTGALTKTTSGTVTLSGANTYTGVTSVLAGTLIVGANAPSGSAGALGNAVSAVLLGNTSGTDNAALLVGGAFTVGRAVTGQAGSSGTATIGGNTAHSSVFSGAITLAKNSIVTAASGGTATLSGVVSGAFSLSKTGDGTAVLSNTNTFGGAGKSVTFAAGALSVSAEVGLGDAANTWTFSGGGLLMTAAFNVSRNIDLTSGNNTITTSAGDSIFSGVISGNGGLIKAGASKLTLNNINTYQGTTAVNGGTLKLDGGAAISNTAGAVSVAAGSTLTLGANETISALTSGGTVDGAFTLTAATYGFTGGTISANLGTGTLTQASGSTALNGTAGATTVNINGGTLTLGSANRLDDTAALTVNGGTFDLGTFSDTVGAVVLQAGTIQNGTLTGSSYGVQAGSVSAILAGGGIPLDKTTSGTVTLSGLNTYDGPTTISGGTLSASMLADGGSSSNIGASTASGNLLLDGGVLQYTGSGHSTDRLFTLTENGGGIEASGSGELNFTNTSSVEFDGTGARTLTLAGSNTGQNILAAALVDGTGGATSIIKDGAGTWVLTGVNTYTGTGTINGGTLEFPCAGGEVTVQQGDLSLAVSLGLTGGGAIMSQGALSPATSMALTGNEMTATQDSLWQGYFTAHQPNATIGNH